jgi:hypothetical protein
MSQHHHKDLRKKERNMANPLSLGLAKYNLLGCALLLGCEVAVVIDVI